MPDASRSSITPLSWVLEACPTSAAILRVPDGALLYANAAAHAAADVARRFDECIVGEEQLDIQLRRWTEFCTRATPYSFVQTFVEPDGERLVRCMVWPAVDPTGAERLAVVVAENLRSGPWSATTAEWIDRWPQPAIAIANNNEVEHLNTDLLRALGYEPTAEVDTTHRKNIETAIIDFHADARDDGRARQLIVPDRFDVPVEFVMGRFPKLSVLDAGTTIVTGYTVTPITPIPDRLTAREAAVVRRLALGSRVVHIASELGLSPHTVRNHLRAVFLKLGVASQSELISLVSRAREP